MNPLVPGNHRMDWTGTIALVVGVGALLTIFNELARLAKANFVMVAVLFLLAAMSGMAFWIQEKYTSQPWWLPSTSSRVPPGPCC